MFWTPLRNTLKGSSYYPSIEASCPATALQLWAGCSWTSQWVASVAKFCLLPSCGSELTPTVTLAARSNPGLAACLNFWNFSSSFQRKWRYLSLSEPTVKKNQIGVGHRDLLCKSGRNFFDLRKVLVTAASMTLPIWRSNISSHLLWRCGGWPSINWDIQLTRKHVILKNLSALQFREDGKKQCFWQARVGLGACFITRRCLRRRSGETARLSTLRYLEAQ